VQGLGLLVILFFFGLAGGVVGRQKGSSFVVWFLVSACAPVLGLLAAVCYRWENRELRRECPSCGAVIKLYDAVCIRCGDELEFPDYAIASQNPSPNRLGGSLSLIGRFRRPVKRAEAA
jgi:hypothetical protein